MRKSIDLRNEQTILKIEALQRDLSLSAPQIVDRALNSYIIELTNSQEMRKTINAYINNKQEYIL